MGVCSVLQDGIRTHRIWWTVVLAWYVVTFFPGLAAAWFASRYSMSIGEEYNDNILFSEPKQHDFVTVLVPALHFIYQPERRSDVSLTADVNTPAEIYTRHSELTNIGDRLSFLSRLSYPYSPDLTFNITEC